MSERHNIIKIFRRNEHTVGFVAQQQAGTANRGGGFNEYVLTEAVFPEDISGFTDEQLVDRHVDEDVQKHVLRIPFQDGAHTVVGPNGILDDMLLVVVQQRMGDFAKGPFSCQENVDAAVHAGRALSALESRFKKRQERGVAGKYEK